MLGERRTVWGHEQVSIPLRAGPKQHALSMVEIVTWNVISRWFNIRPLIASVHLWSEAVNRNAERPGGRSETSSDILDLFIAVVLAANTC